MKKYLLILMLIVIMFGYLTIFNYAVLGASRLEEKKTSTVATYETQFIKTQADVEKLRDELYRSAIEATNRSGQATSRLITFVGIIATIFGVIIALAGGFIGFEALRARQKSKDAIRTLDEAKSFVEDEVKKLNEYVGEVKKLIQLTLDQLKEDTERAGKKIEETSAKKIEEIQEKDVSLEREGKIELLEKRIKFFEEIGMPDDPKVLYAKAMMCKEKGMLNESLELLRKVVSYEPGNKDAYFYIGYIESSLKNLEKALEAYTKVLDIDQNSLPTHNNLGLVFKQLEKFDKALELFSKAIELNPKYALAYSNKIETLKGLKRYDEALECVYKLLEFEPQASNYRKMVTILRSLNRDEEALEAINKAIELEDGNVEDHKIKLTILEKLNRSDEMLTVAQQIIAIEPTVKNRQYLARLSSKTGELDKALNEYKVILPIQKALIVQECPSELDLLNYFENLLLLDLREEAESFCANLDEMIQTESYPHIKEFLLICLLFLNGRRTDGFQNAFTLGKSYALSKTEKKTTWNFDDINPFLKKRLPTHYYRVCCAMEDLLNKLIPYEEFEITIKKLEADRD